VTAYLAREALGPENVIGICVMNDYVPKDEYVRANAFVDWLGIQKREVDVTDMLNQLAVSMDITEKIEISTLNCRIIDTVIRTQCRKSGALFLGTVNASERMTGWYPKGALVGDFCPLGDLFKIDVMNLAVELGIGYLCDTVSKSADQICSSCGNFPKFANISFQELDTILSLYDMGRFHSDTMEKTCKEYSLETDMVSTVSRQIQSQMHKNDVFPHFPRYYFQSTSSMDHILIGGVPAHYNLPWYLTLKEKCFHQYNINCIWRDFTSTEEMCEALRNNEIDLAVILTEGIVEDIILHDSDTKIVQIFIETPRASGILTETDDNNGTVPNIIPQWPSHVIAARNYVIDKKSQTVKDVLTVINNCTKSFKDIPSIDLQIAKRYGKELEEVDYWLDNTQWSQRNLTSEEITSIQENLLKFNLIDKVLPHSSLVFNFA